VDFRILFLFLHLKIKFITIFNIINNIKYFTPIYGVTCESNENTKFYLNMINKLENVLSTGKYKKLINFPTKIELMIINVIPKYFLIISLINDEKLDKTYIDYILHMIIYLINKNIYIKFKKMLSKKLSKNIKNKTILMILTYKISNYTPKSDYAEELVEAIINE
jgi:hypothetical protein